MTRVKQNTGEYSFKASQIVLTNNGKDYSRIDRPVVFNFTQSKVSYLYWVEDTVLVKDFEVSLSKKSYDHCLHYYVKEINNLFVLDYYRRTLQIYGSNEGGKGRKNFSGHTFVGMVPMEPDEMSRVSRGNN